MSRETIESHYIFEAVEGAMQNQSIRVHRTGFHVIKEIWEGNLLLSTYPVFWSENQSEAANELKRLQGVDR